MPDEKDDTQPKPWFELLGNGMDASAVYVDVYTDDKPSPEEYARRINRALAKAGLPPIEPG